jgi:hypothetical protein
MQPVPITTNVVSSNPTQAIQHSAIKFVSDLRQVGGFLWFPPPIKVTATISSVKTKNMLVWLVHGALRHFQQYFSYIVAVTLIGGGTLNKQGRRNTIL